jgi:hypothetical protein
MIAHLLGQAEHRHFGSPWQTPDVQIAVKAPATPRL